MRNKLLKFDDFKGGTDAQDPKKQINSAGGSPKKEKAKPFDQVKRAKLAHLDKTEPDYSKVKKVDEGAIDDLAKINAQIADLDKQIAGLGTKKAELDKTRAQLDATVKQEQAEATQKAQPAAQAAPAATPAPAQTVAAPAPQAPAAPAQAQPGAPVQQK
jgi:hypothetical protein